MEDRQPGPGYCGSDAVPAEGARLPFWKGETRGRTLRTSLAFGRLFRELGKRRSQVILVADEDAEYRTRVRRTLEDRYQVVEAADGDAVFSCMADYEYKLAAVILSMTLADPDGCRCWMCSRGKKRYGRFRWSPRGRGTSSWNSRRCRWERMILPANPIPS